MKTHIINIFILSIVIFISSCSKEEQNLADGTYKGNFKVTYNSAVQTGQTSIEIKDGKFTCTSNANRIPAGGSGTYTFSNNKITFNEQNFYTADFDWNLILSGTYNYTFNGKTLRIFASKNGVGVYEYELLKQ